MQNSLPRKVQGYIKEHLRKKHWKQIVTVLACVVVFCTTYALILPALTVTDDTFCGKTAHTHSDECYEKTLICGKQEAETVEGASAHTHTDACYTTQRVTSCGLEETADHTHGESCYDADGNLVCGLEESQGHTHTEACYTEESVLTCGLEESASAEGELHVHTDACYEKTLTCRKEEHEHTLACYSNPNAEPEENPDSTSAGENSDGASRPMKQDSATETIALGESKTVSVEAGQIVKLQFTPDYTHQYVFAASSSGDSYGLLYDADGNQLASNDEGGGSGKFKLSYDLNGGETYYWGVKWYSSGNSGEITVNLKQGNHAYVTIGQGELFCSCGESAPLSGECGSNLYYSFDLETGALSITGTGTMYDEVAWPDFKERIESVTIAEGATSIGENAFANCSGLKTVVLPDTLTSIGSNAFDGCKQLTKIALPKSLVSIGNSAFKECALLSEMDLSQTAITAIAYGTFTNCPNLKTVVLPDTLTRILGYAFYGCKQLTEIVLPKSLTSIGSHAFCDCASLSEIDLSQTAITAISDSTFNHCTSLETVVLPDTLTSIGSNAFDGCKQLTKIALPKSLVRIDYSAFFGCTSLAEMDLSQTAITAIEYNTFYMCSGLKRVTLPSSLTKIGNNAFFQCLALTEIVLPEAVTSVGSDAFRNCDGLTELRLEAKNVGFAQQSKTNATFHVTVAGTVDNLTADAIKALADMGCGTISFEGANYLTAGGWQADFLPERLKGLPQAAYFADAQGVLYRIDSETNTASVFYCPPGIRTYTVLKELPAMEWVEAPIPVTGVDSSAFREASELTALTFEAPETITNLADLAFYRAINLESINGQADAAAVLATFPSDDLNTGVMLFWQTKITGSSGRLSGDALVVQKENLTVTVAAREGKYLTPGQSEDGTYLYYTGETATTTVTVSNPDSSAAADGTVVRVYFCFDSRNGRLSYSVGAHTVVSESGNRYTMQIVQPDTAGCYYMELERPKQGDTISIELGSAYPSPTSGGGVAAVWCGVLTEAEKTAVGDRLLPVTTYQSMNWTTAADTFPVTKTEDRTGDAILKGDGTGGAYISQLCYVIRMSRAGTTLEGVGKDYMRYVDFEDVLTLPEGVTLAPNVLQSIKDGAVETIEATYELYVDAGNKQILTIRPNNGRTNLRYLERVTLSLDENDNLVIRWRFRNANSATEIGNISFTCYFHDNTLLVPEPQADKTYTVHNRVTARQHFTYSGDQVQSAECTTKVKTANSSLTIRKRSVYTSYNTFGRPYEYTITAENPGALSYERLAYLTDDLPSVQYMTPADLAAVFAADPEHELTVTIVYATLCEAVDGKQVFGIDGTEAVTELQNSGSNTEYRGMSNTDPDTAGYESSTITIAWGTDNRLQITEGERSFSCAAEEAAIRSVLNSLGLVVTRRTQYCLKWDFHNADGTVRPLPGGAKIIKTIYCTNKDTFMLLDNDTRNEHPMEQYTVRNTAYGKASNNEELVTSPTIFGDMSREFYLGKDWTLDGQAIDGETAIRQGDILDYTLRVTHKAISRYDALPLVDHMSGAQVLLVPAAKNSGAEWAQNLQVLTDNGTEYYVLRDPGTYHRVWTSDTQLADTVEVTLSASGPDTLIKWYLVDYGGDRTDTVTYRSYVCPSEITPDALTYSLNNESWLNDHQSHRLYAPLEWEGTVFDVDKVIVDAVGDTGAGWHHSPVSEGETVVYRLVLRSPTDADGNPYPMTLTGRDMYDALPSSNSTYRWSKENVRITYLDDYTVTNGDHWSVEEPSAGDQQYIRWADDFSISFTGAAYIYVELDFPSGIPWQEYTARYALTTLVNSFQALSAQRSVTHTVSVAAQARLQKGVYDTGYLYINGNYFSYRSDMSIADDRLYYQNNDVMTRAVRYYVTLYNAGPINLYLTDMQDLLPRGFTYASSSSFQTNNTTDNKVQVLNTTVDSGFKVSARVTATTSTDETGRQRVSFHFSKGYRISYDEARQMCYLKPGQYIDFVYFCRTNEAPDTDDAARNVITMPYYDLNNGGVVVDADCRIISAESDRYTPNDGGCDVLDHGQIENLGFTGGTNDTQWLTSAVTVVRGDIKPGITKELTSKTSGTGETTRNPVSAAPSDILNWTIKTENDGTDSLSDYVLTDRMQAPYMFTGNVSYTIYDTPDSDDLIAEPVSAYLFSIAKGDEDGTLSITTNNREQKTLTIGGDPVTLSCGWNYSKSSASTSSMGKAVEVQLSITRDAEDNAVLSLHFPDNTMAVPEGGNSILTLSTYNADNLLVNKQFINACFITPLAQVWDGATNKGNSTMLDTPFWDGELPTVRNSAPVTTSYGYVTSSSKRVAEADRPDNTAACTDETNFIVLEDGTKRFTYTLAVDNSTPKAMDKFVLIDSLPEVGDHTVFLTSDPRFSEFKVSLADAPNFSVTVTDKDGNVSTLNADSYTIEYSGRTEFTAEDWNGTGAWSSSAENARSIRLKIFDSTGTLIPAESTVSLSFTCKIDDPDVQPGQIAWNSFGYHYRLVDEVNELEAAPLKVGVKLPSVPELRKLTVDPSGQPRSVEQDETFRFLVYPGAALSGEYASKEELTAALGDTPYEEFTVTVKAGESLSESVRLQTDKWKWTEGQVYTVVELSDNEAFEFRRFLNSKATSYSLTYTPAQTQVITCENTSLRWNIALTKENTSHEPLGGAVFALYSPNASDQLPAVPDGYAGLSIALSLEHNDRTWYLASVQTSDADGKLGWDDLLREQYYLLEVKAPDGYNTNSPAGQILKRENAEQGHYSLTVVNRLGYSMPESGGPGTHLYTVGGTLLLLSAGALLLYYHLRRRRGDEIFD